MAQPTDFYKFEEEFRDTLSTVDAQGKRLWVFAKEPHGSYHKRRIWVTMILLALFFLAPFASIHGRPLVLLNLFERKFIILGQVFWPQDFFLLALTLITLFVFVILFTVAFGRLWCGWACPQTLFMEMVFRKIEYWIEGDANNQRKLNNAPWTTNKIVKKGTKHFIYIIISIIIAHTSMAYLIGIDQVKDIVTNSPADHMPGFLGLFLFTVIFYEVFAWFREQACIAVCPYGRLQSVLLTKDSLVVAYDWLRGEPRGKLKKNSTALEEKNGDCIDCKLCVHVCPTGIDIRNGTQLECVNCTACIDACDEVMLKISKPKGLIRYSSYRGIQEGVLKIINPRIIGYAVVLTCLVSLLSYFIFTRSDIQTTILKAPGTLYSRSEDGKIVNLYIIEFVNKTFDDIPLEVKIESPIEASITRVGNNKMVVPKEGMLKTIYMVKLPEEMLIQMQTKIAFGIYENNKLLKSIKATFLGPVKSFKK